MATRQFDAALLTYEAILASTDFTPRDMELLGILDDYLELSWADQPHHMENGCLSTPGAYVVEGCAVTRMLACGRLAPELLLWLETDESPRPEHERLRRSIDTHWRRWRWTQDGQRARVLQANNPEEAALLLQEEGFDVG